MANSSNSNSTPESGISGIPDREIGSQGLRKRILRRGVSWRTPFPGDEVEVHYNGRVEGGERIGSSHDRGTPFRFKLGQREVIEGWDDGVATMKKGEKCILTIPPELGYGEAGSPPLIPPNSILIFEVELLSWNSIRDLKGDGGILKKITREGEGWATPGDADEVLAVLVVPVIYDTKLENGTSLSKSDIGVEFHINDGHICPAISHALKTMRKGEKAELSVKFHYGFGKFGNECLRVYDAIPSKSNLNIKLELVSWKRVIDVTGDGKVLKKIIKAGQGFDRPNEGATIKVVYAGKFRDGTVFCQKGTNEDPFEFVSFEEQINEGLDRAIMTMRKGEQALVTISSDFLFDHDVPQRMFEDSTCLYEVELIDFTKDKPFWKMDTLEKLNACETRKLEGNALFQAGKFCRASKKYEKERLDALKCAVKYVEFDHTFTDEDRSLANALKLSCYLNNAACKVKLGEYLDAVTLCSKVLEFDSSNVKALYRRSQSYLRTSELEKAEADIKRALTIDPTNRDVRMEYKTLKDRQKEYAKYQAGIFSTMLSKMC
ncbi:FKBP-type peptidyl-prolyl cis-trans isomerase domain [Dillenia turbinata]|uniref:peptidylprolyl isomerase n=1 Tax=Dillenia turbinata TaxID=194707 RepID=A0AAN8VXE4_9MAGN